MAGGRPRRGRQRRGLPRAHGHPPRHRPAAVGAPPARRPTSGPYLPEPLVADDAATQPEVGGRARRLAHVRVPRAARRALADRARGAAAARRVRLPVRRDRGRWSTSSPAACRQTRQPHPPQAARPRARRVRRPDEARASRSWSATLLATIASGDVDAGDDAARARRRAALRRRRRTGTRRGGRWSAPTAWRDSS